MDELDDLPDEKLGDFTRLLANTITANEENQLKLFQPVLKSGLLDRCLDAAWDDDPKPLRNYLVFAYNCAVNHMETFLVENGAYLLLYRVWNYLRDGDACEDVDEWWQRFIRKIMESEVRLQTIVNAFISNKKRKDFDILLHGEGYEFLKLTEKDCEVLNVTKE